KSQVCGVFRSTRGQGAAPGADLPKQSRSSPTASTAEAEKSSPMRSDCRASAVPRAATAARPRPFSLVAIVGNLIHDVRNEPLNLDAAVANTVTILQRIQQRPSEDVVAP